MDKIIELLNSDPNKAIDLLTAKTKDSTELDNLRKEYSEKNREQRSTQIGLAQKNKEVGESPNKRFVEAVRISLPFQNKICKSATAFEVGEPVTISPSEENVLSDEILRLWRSNRIDDKIQKAILLQKSELQCALQFYIKDLKPSNWFNKIIGLNENKDVKCNLLENKNGTMTPYYDEYGHMIYFTWQYKVLNDEDKAVNYTTVYDKDNVYNFKEDSGKYVLEGKKTPHGFGKIPIVYFEQDKPEWYLSEDLIDRLELTLSRLSESNDYTGHPIMVLVGDVEGMPGKDDSGKVFTAKQTFSEETQKWVSGDVKFASYDQAPDSIKLEIETILKFIYSLSSTTDLSFDALKGMGNIAGVAVRLMFLDPIIKAKMNEGINRTSLERIINVMIGGIVTTTHRRSSSEAKKTFFKIKFNSIIPDDLKATVETVVNAVNAGIMSVELAVEKIGASENSSQELDKINNDKNAAHQKEIEKISKQPKTPDAPE